MFNRLFNRRRALERHTIAPLAEQRLRYLSHCTEQGTTKTSLRRVAQAQLIVVEQLGLKAAGKISSEQIEAAADRWAALEPPQRKTKDFRKARLRFISVATRWLRFLGRLDVPALAPSPYAHLVREVADYMQREKGLASNTIRIECFYVEKFLNFVWARHDSLGQLTVRDLDQALAQNDSQSQARVTIRTKLSALRAFFRYAETRGWCTHGPTDAIILPRIFKSETLPLGPSWQEVQLSRHKLPSSELDLSGRDARTWPDGPVPQDSRARGETDLRLPSLSRCAVPTRTKLRAVLDPVDRGSLHFSRNADHWVKGLLQPCDA
jgi:hypothetical protein